MNDKIEELIYDDTIEAIDLFIHDLKTLQFKVLDREDVNDKIAAYEYGISDLEFRLMLMRDILEEIKEEARNEDWLDE